MKAKRVSGRGLLPVEVRNPTVEGAMPILRFTVADPAPSLTVGFLTGGSRTDCP